MVRPSLSRSNGKFRWFVDDGAPGNQANDDTATSGRTQGHAHSPVIHCGAAVGSMTGTTALSVAAYIEGQLDKIAPRRNRLLAQRPSPRRSELLAEASAEEADLWSMLFDETHVRVYWLAALAAESSARQAVTYWRHRADIEVRNWPTTVKIPALTRAMRIHAELLGSEQ